VVYFDVVGGDSFLKTLQSIYKEFRPARIAIDSLTTLTDSLIVSELREDTAFSMVQVAETVSPIPTTERIISKTMLYHLLNVLRSFDSTVILTSELPEKSDYLSADNVSEFICDGVIILNYLGVGAVDFRSIIIRKMRYTGHKKDNILYEISPIGIEIKKEEESI